MKSPQEENMTSILLHYSKRREAYISVECKRKVHGMKWKKLVKLKLLNHDLLAVLGAGAPHNFFKRENTVLVKLRPEMYIFTIAESRCLPSNNDDDWVSIQWFGNYT